MQQHIDERFQTIDARIQTYSDQIENGHCIGGEYDMKIKIEREMAARGELAIVCQTFNLNFKPLNQIKYATNQRCAEALQRKS